MTKTILVIGGAGYLGSIVCRKLLSKGYGVRVLDNLTYTDIGIRELYSNSNFNLIKGDIRNIEDIIKSLKDVYGVIHLAAIVGDSASEIDTDETTDINYLSTKLIAWACKYHKIKRFIFSSTASVYGENDKEELYESSVLNPLSTYAVMKLKSENALLEMTSDDFRPIILRMGTLYGVSNRMRFDLVINWFIVNAIQNKRIELFGGEQKRCFCNVDDAADVYITLLETEHVSDGIYNLSTENFKILDIANLISEYIKDIEVRVNEKSIDKRSYITSSKKLKDSINWVHKHTIKDTIQDKRFEMYDDYTNPIYNNYEYLKRKK